MITPATICLFFIAYTYESYVLTMLKPFIIYMLIMSQLLNILLISLDFYLIVL
ncbi:conserved hypothetical protein [Xenorhabdus bovienii str. Jollieti]|nr:conserved hypothetical protein [Xenorhabdus bovienii str. Jollieti]